MIQHYVISVGAIVLLSVSWLVVQRAWRKSFADLTESADALAGRSGCHGCSGGGSCGRNGMNRACEARGDDQEKRP